MKLAKQIATGIAVLVLAVVIVDCSKNIQEVLEEASKLVHEQTPIETPKPKDLPAVPEVKVDQEKERAQDTSVVASSKPASIVVRTPIEQVDASQAEEIKSKSSAESPSKESTTKKYRVITVWIPDDAKVPGTIDTKFVDELEAATEKEATATEEKAADKKQPEPADEDVAPSEAEENEEPKKDVVEAKAGKKYENKNKVSNKKSKGDTKKRDKRETKTSGRGKNGRARSSAEKSKKYANKKKSTK